MGERTIPGRNGEMREQKLTNPTERSIAILTQRQVNILTLLAQGVAHEALPRRIGLSTTTIDDILADACTSLQVPQPIDAVVKGIKTGFIDSKAVLAGSSPQRVAKLLPSERQVLEGLSDSRITNRTNKGLAEHLRTRERTIKYRLKQINTKLSTYSRLHATAVYTAVEHAPAPDDTIDMIFYIQDEVTKRYRPKPDPYTATDIRVLELLIQGKTVQEIVTSQGLTAAQVKESIERNRTEVKTLPRALAMIEGIKRGGTIILPPEEEKWPDNTITEEQKHTIMPLITRY
jgi:DNA-binding NarL/FixJ family response regulator/DNA-binding CsgD family transcriptional regulator